MQPVPDPIIFLVALVAWDEADGHCRAPCLQFLRHDRSMAHVAALSRSECMIGRAATRPRACAFPGRFLIDRMLNARRWLVEPVGASEEQDPRNRGWQPRENCND